MLDPQGANISDIQPIKVRFQIFRWSVIGLSKPREILTSLHRSVLFYDVLSESIEVDQARGYKTCFMLNSDGHEILPAHKC